VAESFNYKWRILKIAGGVEDAEKEARNRKSEGKPKPGTTEDAEKHRGKTFLDWH
jgi:hypothetical protein